MPKPKSISYQENLKAALQDPLEATHYLNACLEDGDPGVFLTGLRDVANSMGGMAKLSRGTKLNRESLYRMLSESGNPSLASLTSVLRVFGLRFVIQPSPPAKQRKPKVA
jgi:probable addiction module antidote protein